MFGDILSDLMRSGNFKATKLYHNNNGGVFLGVGNQYCYVAVVKRLAQAQELIRERGHLDYISAVEFFDNACRYVRDEIEWTEPVRKYCCTYNPNRPKGCTDKNCPKKLGGPTYREIFVRTCPFRKTR